MAVVCLENYLAFFNVYDNFLSDRLLDMSINHKIKMSCLPTHFFNTTLYINKNYKFP